MTYDQNIKTLKMAIAEECKARMAATGFLDTSQVAAWLVRSKKKLVLDALADLVWLTMEQRNDDIRTKRRLQERPELQVLDPGLMRSVSNTLGVECWFLYELAERDPGRFDGCLAAAALIHEMQAAAISAK